MLIRFLASLALSSTWAGNGVASVEVSRLESKQAVVTERSAAPTAAVLPTAQVGTLPLNLVETTVKTDAVVDEPVAPTRERLIDTLSAEPPKLDVGIDTVGGVAENDFLRRARLGSAGASHETLVEAYQDGALDKAGASPAARATLAKAADHAVREKIAQADFKTYYLYGGLFGTKMYEAPELSGVLLKSYSTLFGLFGNRALKGYTLAKERLGDYFAHTTIVENVEVTIEGKKKTLRWALVQEKVAVEKIQNYGKRSYEVLVGMLARGVRDNDQRPRNIEPVDVARNLGEAPDGRFVHFDADFFAAEKSAEEGPKRVRDPPVLQDAIREAQLKALAQDRSIP